MYFLREDQPTVQNEDDYEYDSLDDDDYCLETDFELEYYRNVFEEDELPGLMPCTPPPSTPLGSWPSPKLPRYIRDLLSRKEERSTLTNWFKHDINKQVAKDRRVREVFVSANMYMLREDQPTVQNEDDYEYDSFDDDDYCLETDFELEYYRNVFEEDELPGLMPCTPPPSTPLGSWPSPKLPRYIRDLSRKEELSTLTNWFKDAINKQVAKDDFRDEMLVPLEKLNI